jgi:hypothetical protein
VDGSVLDRGRDLERFSDLAGAIVSRDLADNLRPKIGERDQDGLPRQFIDLVAFEVERSGGEDIRAVSALD